MQLIDIRDHFNHRSKQFESSARWVRDERLFTIIEELANVSCNDWVLDVATGTGIIAKLFFKKARMIIGLDFTEAMFKKALSRLNFMVSGQSESQPFRDDIFNLIICRQGLQFMQPKRAIEEMFRVCAPLGQIMLIQLTAFNEEDKDYAFKIQFKRQPVRANCFLEEDLISWLKEVGCRNIKSRPYFSYESVNNWINDGALSLGRQAEIKKLYYEAPPTFKKIHELKFFDDDIIDKMKITIVWGYKAAAGVSYGGCNKGTI